LRDARAAEAPDAFAEHFLRVAAATK